MTVVGRIASIFVPLVLMALPIIAHWMWTGRKASIRRSYQIMLLYYAIWFGRVYAFVCGIILVCAVYEQFAHMGWNYPLWSIPVLMAMMGVGAAISLGAKWWKRNMMDSSS